MRAKPRLSLHLANGGSGSWMLQMASGMGVPYVTAGRLPCASHLVQAICSHPAKPHLRAGLPRSLLCGKEQSQSLLWKVRKQVTPLLILIQARGTVGAMGIPHTSLEP
jgi:hypothetical protein